MLLGFFESDAGIGDRNAVFEGLPGLPILSAGMELAFDHDAQNAFAPGTNLCTHFANDVTLSRWVLPRVARQGLPVEI
jgi:hypothetical protein